MNNIDPMSGEIRRESSMSPSRKADRKGGPDTRPSTRLSASQAKKFLATYKEAWETHHPELASQLFTRDAEYRADTFSKPIVGREGICHYWHSAISRQEEIHFKVHGVFRTGYTLMAEWSCLYRHRRTAERRELKGSLFAEFYGAQVRNFRAYWDRRTL